MPKRFFVRLGHPSALLSRGNRLYLDLFKCLHVDSSGFKALVTPCPAYREGSKQKREITAMSVPQVLRFLICPPSSFHLSVSSCAVLLHVQGYLAVRGRTWKNAATLSWPEAEISSLVLNV